MKLSSMKSQLHILNLTFSHPILIDSINFSTLNYTEIHLFIIISVQGVFPSFCNSFVKNVNSQMTTTNGKIIGFLIHPQKWTIKRNSDGVTNSSGTLPAVNTSTYQWHILKNRFFSVLNSELLRTLPFQYPFHPSQTVGPHAPLGVSKLSLTVYQHSQVAPHSSLHFKMKMKIELCQNRRYPLKIGSLRRTERFAILNPVCSAELGRMYVLETS